MATNVALTVTLGVFLCITFPDNAAAQVSMSTGQGKTMTLTLQTLPDSREYQYCELVFDYGDAGNDIYSTSPLAECSLEWWDNLDLGSLAEEFGANAVFKNGPQWWSMDEVGVMASKPVSVAGVDMVFGANLPPGTMNMPKYGVFSPAKFQNLLWGAGKPTYQLVDSEGYVYVLQGHKIPLDSLATLGDRFQDLPDGWEYRVNVVSEDLLMNLTPDVAIPSVQDEFEDPRMTRNLSLRADEIAALRSKAASHFTPDVRTSAKPLVLSEHARERLRALGYVGDVVE